MNSLVKTINILMRPVVTRVNNMVARAVVSLVKDSLKLQQVQLQVMADETRDDCERFQEYGFTSVPIEGAEAVVVYVGGRRDHPLVVAVDDRRHRKKDLAPGEVALYTDEGAAVYLKRGRVVVIDDEIRLGSDSASNFVALANLVQAELTTLKNAISAAAVVPGDGGASFKAALLAALTAWPGSVAAGKVKAE